MSINKEERATMGTTFGQYIRAVRTTAGCSQDTMAEKIKVEKSTISRWEAGKAFPKRTQLKRLIDLFPSYKEQMIDAWLND